ncbi:hypothetical protein BV22DRAFT_1075069, partial [Leucogyrophana mollusca]
MASESLIVPTLLPNGSLQYPTTSSTATALEFVANLLQHDEVKSEILGDLSEGAWALQRIRRQPKGHQWEEEDLEALGNGIISSTALIAPLLDRDSSNASERHFSAFPLTTHLHTPVLRLVSLHPLLTLTVTFFRVPEIHDGFRWTVYFTRTSTVDDIICSVIEELGLSKTLPIPGAGNIEYVLETKQGQRVSKIPSQSLMSRVLEAASSETDSGSPTYHFCVPDEWYRRSKPRALSVTSLQPSEETIKHLKELESEEEDGEGTAKQKKSLSEQHAESLAVPRPSSPDWRSSLSQSRLTNLFSSWSQTTAPAPTPAPPSNRKSVSEPTLMEQHTGGSVSMDRGNQVAEESELFDAAEFEQLLDELDMKDSKRAAMYQLPPSHKRYFIEQNRRNRVASTDKRQTVVQPTYSATYGPSSAGALLPRLVPQLTGDSGLMKRLSTWGVAPSTAPPVVSTDLNRSSGEFDMGRGREPGRAQIEKVAETMQPLQSQSTGSLWSSWWASSGGEKISSSAIDKATGETATSAKRYVDGIRNSRATDSRLVKHLISLRVHLSTAKLPWVEGFIEENGMAAIASLLAELVGKGGKRKALTHNESTVLLEVIKCLRVLLNTQPGFNSVLSSPTLITHIAYSLHGSSLKSRTLASELLAAICVLSLIDGHKTVLAALSDYAIAYDESFRFESLVSALRISDPHMDEASSNDGALFPEEEGIWEARIAFMALVNALTNCPESLEERILLREEFGRRGLNEVIVTLRYTKPPDSLLTQLDVYSEEKFEDEEDMRERVRRAVQENGSHAVERSESDAFVDELLRVAKELELDSILMTLLGRVGGLIRGDIEFHVRLDLLTILDTFLEQLSMVTNLEDDWLATIKRFVESVRYLTGQALDIKSAKDADIESTAEEVLESMRVKVERLSEENSKLQNDLAQRTTEANTLKSLSPKPSALPGRGPPEGVNGLVQRIVQKERQVMQLQAEVDRLQAQNPTEAREADDRAKRERDRTKWSSLTEEIAKLKMKTGEMDKSLVTKDKEILYLKRALESVYSRFQTREEERGADLDVQLIAAHMIEKFTKKDDEIIALKAHVSELERALAEKPKYLTETDFKAQTSPPPPPPVKPPRTPASTRSISSVNSLSSTYSTTAPPP